MALIAGLSCAAANAADLGLSATAGTTGLGLHVSVPIQPKLNARVGFGYLNYDDTGSTTDADYNFKMKLRTLDVLAD